MFQLDETVVRELDGKIVPHVFLHVEDVKVFEISETSEVETEQNGYHLGIRHRAGTVSTLFPIIGFQLVFFDFQIVKFAEIVRNTKNFRNFVPGKHICIF